MRESVYTLVVSGPPAEVRAVQSRLEAQQENLWKSTGGSTVQWTQVADLVYQDEEHRAVVGDVLVLGYSIDIDEAPPAEWIRAMGNANPSIYFRTRCEAGETREAAWVGVLGDKVAFRGLPRGGAVRIAERAEPSVVRAAREAVCAKGDDFYEG